VTADLRKGGAAQRPLDAKAAAQVCVRGIL
jgi:hypothetical protein